MFKISVALFIAALSLQTFANEIKLKFINMSPKKTKLLAHSNQASLVKKGDQLSFTNTCSFTVMKSTQDKILLSALNCKDRSKFDKNSTIKVSATQLKKSPQTATSQASMEYQGYNTNTLSHGFRVGVNQASLSSRFTISSNNEIYNEFVEDNFDHQYGVNIGYVNIGLYRPGFMGHITHTQFTENAESIRLTANATFAFHENIYAYGGMNIHRYTHENGSDILDPGVGYQTGLGVQLNQTFGLDLSYLVLRNKGSDPDFEIDYELELEGIEATLHVTF